MYRYQHDLFKKEEIYIAGPECAILMDTMLLEQ